MVDWNKEIKLSAPTGRHAKQPEPETSAIMEPSRVMQETAAVHAEKPQKTSFLKKEISFRRKPKVHANVSEPVAEKPAVEAPQKPQSQKSSFLKKEISFGRKSKARATASEPVEVPAAELPKQPERQKSSFLKKEISFGRSSKARATASEPVAEKPAVEAPQKPQKPQSQKSSFLKKEISFGRKPKTKPEAKTENAQKTSFWKKELAVGRKAKPKADPVELPRSPEDTGKEHDPAPIVPELSRSPEDVAEEHAPAPIVPSPVANAEPEPLAPISELPRASVLADFRSTSAGDARPLDPGTLATPAPVIPLPAPHQPAPGPSQPAPAAWEPDQREPVAAVPALALHAPQPAAAAPPVSEEPSSVEDTPVPGEAATQIVAAKSKSSFLKTELSFRRKPKSKAVEPQSASVSEKPSKQSSSFLKKELSFGRKRAKGVPQAPTAKSAKAQPQKKRSKESRKLVGLKIGASQIAAARVENNGSPHLVQVAREPLAPGLVVGGEVKEPELLAAALKKFFEKHKLPRRGVRLGIANNRIGVRTFEISGIEDPKQLTNAIRFRAQEVLPIPLDEAVLDYQVLEESRDAEGGVVRRILLVVAYRELVDRYVTACRQAGIKLAGIDLEAFALLRALAEPDGSFGVQQDAALVVVAIGHDRSTFAVSDGRTCEFTRVLDWGGASLNKAIANVLELSPEEVEPIKRAISLTGGPLASVEGVSEFEMAKVVEAVRSQFQAFARDLVSSLRFYQNQPGSLGIGEIVVTGGTAQLPGLGAELERLLGVRVRVGDPLVRVKLGKRVKQSDDMSSLAAAIGLGIED